MTMHQDKIIPVFLTIGRSLFYPAKSALFGYTFPPLKDLDGVKTVWFRQIKQYPCSESDRIGKPEFADLWWMNHQGTRGDFSGCSLLAMSPVKGDATLSHNHLEVALTQCLPGRGGGGWEGQGLIASTQERSGWGKCAVHSWWSAVLSANALCPASHLHDITHLLQKNISPWSPWKNA